MSEYTTYELTNKETGEVIASTTVEVKPGKQVGITATSKESRDANKHHQEQIDEYKEEKDDAFIHLIYKYGTVIFNELEEKVSGNKNNIHIIRFIILATYATFRGNLSDSNGHGIKKSSLKKIWDTTSRNSINETYSLLLECGYIYETEEGCLKMNKDMVIKGRIKDFYNELKKQDSRYTYSRVYIDNVRAMYHGTEPKQRKQLANLFKALPYIHYKYNIFCSNPTETDKDKVKPLTWTDLARLCGYEEKKHVAKFKKDLISLGVDGRSVIGQFENRLGNKIIVVNPAIYYGDNDLSEVKELQQLFDWVDNK